MAKEQEADIALEGYSPWLTPKRKLIAGGFVLAVAFSAIIYVVTVNTGQFFLSVEEVQERDTAIYGKDIRVNGIVVPGSVVFGEDRIVTFQMVDAHQKSGQPLEVEFKGIPRGQFGVPAVEVVLEGRYQPDQIFHATGIITRESRKYIPVSNE